MAINEISKAQFDDLVKTGPPLRQSSAEERAWFATGSKRVIGALLYDTSPKVWSYVVLRRLVDGRFEWVDASVRRSKEHAVAQLKAAMVRCEAATSPQPPGGHSCSD